MEIRNATEKCTKPRSSLPVVRPATGQRPPLNSLSRQTSSFGIAEYIESMDPLPATLRGWLSEGIPLVVRRLRAGSGSKQQRLVVGGGATPRLALSTPLLCAGSGPFGSWAGRNTPLGPFGGVACRGSMDSYFLRYPTRRPTDQRWPTQPSGKLSRCPTAG